MFFQYMVDMCLDGYLHKNHILDETLYALFIKLFQICLIEASICLRCLFGEIYMK